MKITDLNGKKVCILGFGREGQAMFKAIERHARDTFVTVADQNLEPIEKLISANSSTNPTLLRMGFDTQSGTTVWLRELGRFDVIIKSPGIPPNKELETHHSKLTNSTQIFLDTIAEKGTLVIGVTGSKGKSTTSSLIAAILKQAKKDVLLLGNIGDPAIAHLDAIHKNTIVVLEMSSYQLMNLSVSPHIAVITSFFPEHLDYHGSVEAYLEAKKHITQYQSGKDAVFFNEQSAGAIEIAKEGHGRKIPFSANDSPVKIEETKLLGAHNLSNITAAAKVAQELGVKDATIIEAIKEFHGLPHRLEFVGNYHGIDWVDDAISTTPESTIAALDALGDRVQTIILGGQDRGYDFTKLGERIALSSITDVILFPGSGPKIKQAIQAANAHVEFHEAASMQEAISAAQPKTSPSERTSVRAGNQKPATPIVLLSTASPSYGMFKNFEEKGNLFASAVRGE